MWSRRMFLGLAVGAAGLTGCNELGSLVYFLMPEQRFEAKIKHLPSKDEKKEPRVLILTWSGLETRAEFIHADRQLSELLAGQMTEMAKGSNEKINFVQARKVEEFKNNFPNWREMNLADVGRRFGADYVIYLEINKLSLYETNSMNTLFRGRADITLSLVEVSQPDETPKQENYNCTYPGEIQGPIAVGVDTSPMQFRRVFLSHVAKKLSFYFSKYPHKERYSME